MTSITVAARSRIHASSVIGRSLMMYLRSVCSSCRASRHSAGLRFLSQKMHAVMLTVGRVHRLLGARRHEDLHRVV